MKKWGGPPGPRPTPRSALLFSPLRPSLVPFHYPDVAFYRRRLPHISVTGEPVFITWRLHGSLSPNRSFPAATLTSGQAFAALDRLLDQARTGPFHLRRAHIANMVVEAIYHGAEVLGHYDLHAFVVMPNHVHLLVTPLIPLPLLMKSLKGITAKRANQILGRTENSFWQEESYDHQVRNVGEFEKISSYIELNPVRAGLVAEAKEYRWSSAGWPTGGSAADRGGPPYFMAMLGSTCLSASPALRGESKDCY